MSDFKNKVDTVITAAGLAASIVNPATTTPADLYATSKMNQVRSSIQQTDTGRQNPTNGSTH